MNKLLIVDDSATMRKIILRALRHAGIPPDSMLQAASGVEALEHVAADPGIEMLLCDLNMPEMGGIELVRELRKAHSAADLPIIVVTTEGAKEARDRAIEEGANGYVHKPFTEEALLAALAPYLE